MEEVFDYADVRTVIAVRDQLYEWGGTEWIMVDTPSGKGA